MMGFFNWGRRVSEPQRAAEEALAARRDVLGLFSPNGPEKAIDESFAATCAGDRDRAFERAVKAVDLLHTSYVFGEFSDRQPSSADQFILDSLITALGAMRQQDSDVMRVINGVTEATHRLRTISTSIDAAGGDSTRYRKALDELSRLAPDVDVSEIFWY